MASERYTWTRAGLGCPGPQVRPSLPAEEWQQVDLAIARALAEVAERAGLETVLVLGSGDADWNAKGTYVYLEPFAHVVIGLGHTEKTVSLHADYDLWEPAKLEREFHKLINHAERALHRDTLADAMTSIAEKTRELLCSRGHWARIDRT